MNPHTGKEFREAFKKYGSTDKKTFTPLYQQLNQALRLAKTTALYNMDAKEQGYPLTQQRADSSTEERANLKQDVNNILQKTQSR